MCVRKRNKYKMRKKVISMEMRKCAAGHYYDASINARCPYCETNDGDGVTMPMDYAAMGADDDSKTLPLGYASNPAPQAVDTDDDDDGKTVAIIHQNIGIDPVVGWLVCVEGKEKGRDYRIHTDNNYVGRSEKMDICIRSDETISRENHAVISYDSVDKVYYMSPGDGRSIIRLNDKAIFQTAEIVAYDKIVIGKTKFLFIPLCGAEFEWGGNC